MLNDPEDPAEIIRVMKRSIPDRLANRARAEQAFTLIELMVVVLIIAILIAIALPTYLGARARASDRATQADMRTGLAAALAYYSETADWTGFDATQGKSEESRIGWVDSYPPARGEVSIHEHAGQNLLLVGYSASGTYFCIAQIATNPATETGKSTDFNDFGTVADCSGGW